MGQKSAQNDLSLQNLRHQYLAAIAGNLIFFSHGLMVGWLSPALPILTSDETPLNAPLTNVQISWIGSIMSLSGIVGSFLFTFLTMKFGSKRIMLVLTAPVFLCWTLIYFGDTYYHILISRFCTGLTAGGVQSTIILYISEIADNRIRGRLASFSHLSRNIGILISYCVGSVLPYHVIPCIFIFVPIIFFICFSILPNTPQFHLKNGHIEKAEKSLQYYKGCKGKTEKESIALLSEFEKLKSAVTEQKVDDKISFEDIFKRENFRGILNGIILANLFHLTAGTVFIAYAALIFRSVGVTQINPYYSSIALAIVQILGVLVTSQLSDSLGRKKTLYISLLGSALGLVSFAAYSYLKTNGHVSSSLDWLPTFLGCFVIFTAASGVLPLCPICTIEGLPTPKMRTVGLLISNIFKNIASFYCLKSFPILNAIIGLHGSMLIYAIACTLGSLYVCLFFEETSGKAMDNIRTNASDRVEKGFKK